MVNEHCRHSSSGKDCEFFVAHTIKEKIQQVSSVNKRPAQPGCCNAATKCLSNTLFSVVISDRQRKEVSHGTHTFLECSDDRCSVPLRRHHDFHLGDPSAVREVRDKSNKPCRTYQKNAWPRRRRHAFSFVASGKSQAAAPVTGCRSFRAKPTPSQTAETMAARFMV